MSVPRPDVVVLDTSALFLPFEKRIDIQREVDRLLSGAHIVVPTPVLEELAYLAMSGKGASKRVAKMAISYVMRFEEYRIGGKGDDTVIQTGRELEKKGLNVAIATADQKLRFRARQKGWPVLTVRGHRAFVDGYEE